MRLTFWCLLFFICKLVSSQKVINYCDPSLCPAGTTHIACNNNGAFGPSCPANRAILDLTNEKAFILNRHNFYRNRVASGNLSPYSRARRMLALKWSPQLAFMATLNVKRCIFGHDQCRNTFSFVRSGQNLGTTISSTSMTVRAHLTTIIDLWYNEYVNTNMAIINSYQSSAGPEYGHFTQMITDRTNYVGCAVVRYTANSQINMITACNYASNNVINYPVYKTSTIAGSGCTTGRGSFYTSLCSPNEIINPNSLA